MRSNKQYRTVSCAEWLRLAVNPDKVVRTWRQTFSGDMVVSGWFYFGGPCGLIWKAKRNN